MSAGSLCQGVQIYRTAEGTAPFAATIALLTTLRDSYPDRHLFESVPEDRWKMFDKVCGTDRIRTQLLAGESYQTIVDGWQRKLREFISLRENYLLYE